MPVESKPNLLDLDRKGLEGFFLDRGEKVFRASQIMKWIYERGVTDFADMTNLSKDLRSGLRDSASIRLPEVVADQVSADGSRKWLLRFADGNCISRVVQAFQAYPNVGIDFSRYKGKASAYLATKI